MADVPHILSHYDEARREVPAVLRASPRFLALLLALTEPIQAAEDALWGLIYEGTLERAVGAHLDQWGRLLAQAREGEEDEPYRRRLLVVLLLRRSGGEVPTLVAVAQRLFATDDVAVFPSPPGGFEVQIGVEVMPQPEDVARFVALLQGGAGAGLLLRRLTARLPGSFGWEDDTEALGFDQGPFAEVLYHAEA
jgi:hypothetical protein